MRYVASKNQELSFRVQKELPDIQMLVLQIRLGRKVHIKEALFWRQTMSCRFDLFDFP